MSPVFLWALAALAPLAAMYCLKVRPRRRPTTALFLWQRVFTERKATSLFRRLRDVMSLLLMTLAVLAMVLALTRPMITGQERRDLLILIDHSASMAARDGGATRLARARGEARTIVRAMSGQQRAAIATVAEHVVYHTHFTHDPRRLMAAIDGVQPTAMPMQPAALAELSDRDDWADRYRVILISDGVIGGGQLAGDVELLQVGSSVDNVGLVGADLQRLPGAADRLGLYVQLASTFEASFEADLLVEQAGELRRVLPVTVEPGMNAAQVFELQGEAGPWRVVLDMDDGLALDNVAHLVLPAHQPVRVAVNATDQYFFQHSVLAFEQAGGPVTLADGQADVVLSQGEVVAAPLCVVFQPQGESPLWPGLGEPLGPVVPRLPRGGAADHPALRFLDVEQMQFAGARQVDAPPGASVLVETSDGVPLIWQVRGAEAVQVVVNLDPAASELFFSTHFPVLVHGLVTYLSRRTEPLAATYSPGARVPIPGGGPDVPTQVWRPAAAEPQTLHAVHLGPLNEPGFYRMNNAGGQWLVGMSLTAFSETLLNDRSLVPSSRPLARGWPPSALLLALAILVLVAESFLYHRRKVG